MFLLFRCFFKETADPPSKRIPPFGFILTLNPFVLGFLVGSQRSSSIPILVPNDVFAWPTFLLHQTSILAFLANFVSLGWAVGVCFYCKNPTSEDLQPK